MVTTIIFHLLSQSLSLISFGYARRHIYESWLQPFLQPFFFYAYFCMSWQDRQFDLFPYIPGHLFQGSISFTFSGLVPFNTNILLSTVFQYKASLIMMRTLPRGLPSAPGGAKFRFFLPLATLYIIIHHVNPNLGRDMIVTMYIDVQCTACCLEWINLT
jgi:hypothetical protein